MNVLYILDPATIGGATKAFLSLVMKVKEMGITPIVCSSQSSIINTNLERLGVQTVVTGHEEMITTRFHGRFRGKLKNLKKTVKYVFHDIKAIRVISRSVNMNTIDIIHTNSTRSDIGFFLARLYHKPHIVHIREFGDSDYQCYPLNPFYINLYNKYSSKYICVSNAVRLHWLHKGIDKQKAVTIYDGIDFEKVVVSSCKNKRLPTLRLVMSGNVLPSKGQYLAIMAISKLPKDIQKKLTIDFIGWCSDEYRTELEDLCKKLKLITPVAFLGPHDDILSLLCNYQVGLMCSRSEGFGLVTAEYMFAKLGIIASNSGSCPELIENKINGLLFNSGDENSLADAILCYYQNRDMLIRHADAARVKAIHCFTSQMNANNIYTQYCELINA